MALVASRLKKAGYDVESLGYTSSKQSLEGMADEIRRSIPKRFEDGFMIVGHSLGGLVGLTLADQLGPKVVNRMVMIGTPLLGSPAADIMLRTRLSSLLYGPIWSDLSPAERMQKDHAREGLQIGMVAGVVPGTGALPGGAGDGLIRLSSTQSKALTAHTTVRASHASLLVQKSVVDHANSFLRDARFAA